MPFAALKIFYLLEEIFGEIHDEHDTDEMIEKQTGEKEFTFSDFGLTLGVDAFNALNASYVLQRQGVLAQNGVPLDNAGAVFETLSPRIFRLGARLSFR